MKTQFYIASIIFIISSFLVSCDKEETDKPTISDFELGLEDSKTGYLNSDLHVEAEVVAAGTISTVEIEIHLEESEEEGWVYDSIFTEFSGLKNTTFHKHIDIPSDADTGSYHFHFIVTDMEGYQTEVEDDLYVTYPTDSVAPEVSVTSAPNENQIFADGDVISISGTITDNQKLGGLYIGLVRADQNLEDSEVDATNTITLLHTHDFEEGDSYTFSANIEVGASQDNNITPKDITGDISWQTSDYYIVVKCKDAYGANWAFSDHYPIKINY